MSRRKRAEKREILPDPKHHSLLVTKFVSSLLERGKRSIAEQCLYGAIEIMDEKTSGEGLKTFEKAVKNAQPLLEVKSRRVGGSTYQVPVEVRMDRARALASRWLIQYARNRKGRNMAEKLAAEFMAA